MIVLLFVRTRSQQRDMAAVQAKIAPGVDVMTAGGMFATVIDVDDDVVVLETAPGQRSRWDRRAVARVITDPDAIANTAEEETAGKPSSATDSDGDGGEDSTGNN
jgi:preprotein translocase subunit YajC